MREATVEVFTRELPHPDAPKMAPDENGYIWMPHEAILKAIARRTAADEKVRLEAIQRPINVACITEKAPAPSWKKKKPTWYLIAEEDHMILERTQRFMAERMKATIRTAAADHIPSLTMPGPVVNIVLEASQSTLANQIQGKSDKASSSRRGFVSANRQIAQNISDPKRQWRVSMETVTLSVEVGDIASKQWRPRAAVLCRSSRLHARRRLFAEQHLSSCAAYASWL